LGGLGGGAGGDTVATVGGESISYQQMKNALDRELENYRALGMDLPPALVENVKRGTLSALIQGKLMLAEARRLGIQVSDEEVSEEIQHLPYFQDKEKKTFDVELYRRLLAENHVSPQQFESDVRDSLIHQRMQKFLSDRIRVTPVEVEREFQVSNETRNLAFVRFTREDAMKQMKVSEKEVNDFLADKSHEAQVNGFYAQNNLRYNQPEKVCARHILKRMPPGSNSAKGEKPPKDFLALKPTPANFAKLAEKYSEDPGSKGKGGDLDCFPRGMMDKAFEEVAFSLPAGKVSQPVRSQFGWHYILVTKKLSAVSQPLDKVRRGIAEELIKRERVEEIAKINRAAGERVAKSWPGGEKVETTGEFNSLEGTIPKIGHADEILKAAFDPQAKIQTGPQIFEAQGGVIVATIKDKKSADMAKFAKEKDAYTVQLRERKLRAFLPAWLEHVQEHTKISYNTNLLNQM
jgi:peptidyl-prolyl cis-trans isomerase D